MSCYSCRQEAEMRSSYKNKKRLAKVIAEAEQKDYVIYVNNGKYNFCSKEWWKEETPGEIEELVCYI